MLEADRGNWETAHSLYRQCLAEYGARNDGPSQAWVLKHIAQHHQHRGDVGAAVARCRQALAVLDDQQDAPEQRAHICLLLGELYGRLGEPDRARELIGCGRTILRLLNHT